MMSDQQWEAHMERVREAFHADDRQPDPAFVDEWQKLGKGRRARETFPRLQTAFRGTDGPLPKFPDLRDTAQKTGRWRVMIGRDAWSGDNVFRDNEPGDPLPEPGALYGLPA